MECGSVDHVFLAIFTSLAVLIMIIGIFIRNRARAEFAISPKNINRVKPKYKLFDLHHIVYRVVVILICSVTMESTWW